MISAPILRVVIIVQARMGASRLPGKPLKKVLDKPLLSYLIERLKRVQLSKTIVIATSTRAKDRPIVELSEQENVAFVRGSEADVLSRYVKAAKKTFADVIVRITGDCPIIDPLIIDEAIESFLSHAPHVDYLSNTLERTYPRGMDVEVFTRRALEEAAKNGKTANEKEHVTLYIYKHPEKFKLISMESKKDLSFFRWTVDTEEDFELIRRILESLYPVNPNFGIKEIEHLMKAHPEWIAINQHVQQKQV